jgi:hypothetical protein
LKSKEPKERRQNTTKPRKSSEKSKRPQVDPPLQAADPDLPEPPIPAPPWSESGNGVAVAAAMEHGNGASDPASTAIEAAVIDPPLELVQARAYELFVQRGYQHGHHLEDWLTAERELKSR